jgi:hypothetical protein
MQACLGDQNLQILILYLDDILIFARTFEEMLERLEVVFKRLQEYGLKIKVKKTHLFKRMIKYLGHVVSENGIQTRSQL